MWNEVSFLRVGITWTALTRYVVVVMIQFKMIRNIMYTIRQGSSQITEFSSE